MADATVTTGEMALQTVAEIEVTIDWTLNRTLLNALDCILVFFVVILFGRVCWSAIVVLMKNI